MPSAEPIVANPYGTLKIPFGTMTRQSAVLTYLEL